MIHYMYAVRDSKAEAFLPPFILPRSSMAIRTFASCVNSADHQFAAYPEDYGLFRLANFDDETGLIVAEPTPVLEISGLECVKPKIQDGANGSISDDPPVLPGSEGEHSAE
jgi:hypothetical protein